MGRAALLLALLLAACGGGDDAADGATAFPQAALTSVRSESGDLTIEIRTAPAQPPERGVSDVEYRIVDATGAPVSGLELSVETWMPDMGHGASTRPVVAPTDAGTYVASNVNFFMPGRWELRATIGSAAVDHANVSFQIP